MLPSLEWGGWYEGVATMSSQESKESLDKFLGQHPLVQILQRIEQTTTINELWKCLKSLNPNDVDQLNSPLLDALVAMIPREVESYDDWSYRFPSSITTLQFCLARNYRVKKRALFVAAEQQDPSLCKFILELNLDQINKPGVKEEALEHACRKGSKEVIELLLGHETKLYHYDLCLAAKRGDVEIFEFLLGKRTLDENDLYALLIIACNFGQIQIVTFLLDGYPETHAHKNERLENALIYKNLLTAEVLLDRGANLDAIDLNRVFSQLSQENAISLETFLVKRNLHCPSHSSWMGLWRQEYERERMREMMMLSSFY